MLLTGSIFSSKGEIDMAELFFSNYRVGQHCQQVHHAIVEQAKVDTHHVQADEIRAKGRKMVAWMAMATDAISRLWLAGVVSVRRDRALADLCWLHESTAEKRKGLIS